MFIIWLTICYISFTFLGISNTLVSSIWPTIAVAINVIETNLGIFMGVFIICNVVFLTLASFFIQKLGARFSIALGIFILGLGIVVMSQAATFSICIIAAVLFGIGTGITDTTTCYYIVLYYKPRCLSWLHCFWGVGSAIGPIIMVKLLSLGLTYNNSYLIVALFYILLAILIVVIKIVDDKLRNEKVDKLNYNGNDRPKVDYKEIFTTKKAIPYFGTMFFADFLTGSVSVWLSTYLITVHGIEVGFAAEMITIFFVGLTISRFINGILVEKFGAGKIMFFGFALYTIFSVVMIFGSENKFLLPLIVFCLGVGSAPIYPITIGYANNVFREDQLNGVVGLSGSFAQIGGWVSSVFIGFLGRNFSLNVFVYILIISGVSAIYTLRKLMK